MLATAWLPFVVRTTRRRRRDGARPAGLTWSLASATDVAAGRDYVESAVTCVQAKNCSAMIRSSREWSGSNSS